MVQKVNKYAKEILYYSNSILSYVTFFNITNFNSSKLNISISEANSIFNTCKIMKDNQMVQFYILQGS